ncbi:MAG: SAM-dependent methyltransferase [Gammaproteobacteria bacterium]|nr:MAG: SAM-dependent methyltransferase [Gammaproteobacteria bacterium]
MDRRKHWDRIYRERTPEMVGWYQAEPAISLHLIEKAGLTKTDPIIDVGGGASVLVDHLIQGGFENLAVLDISPEALSHARARLGARASAVQWIEGDVTEFCSTKRYALWHDRAVFHFLTQAADREKYVSTMRASLEPKGHVILATFALDGPSKCSGLEVQRYDGERLMQQFGEEFAFVDTKEEAHVTPTGIAQQFNYFLFRRNRV